MTVDLHTVIQTLYMLLTDVGFQPMTEFGNFDSFEFSDIPIAVVSAEDIKAVGQVYKPDLLRTVFETDTKIVLRLFGKVGDYDDGEELTHRAERLFYAICEDINLLTVSMTLKKAVRYAPLRRLERELELTVRSVNTGRNENVLS